MADSVFGDLGGGVSSQLGGDGFDQRLLGYLLLAMAVDDARAVEVIWRELAAHAVPGQDANAEAPHLARHVTEHDMVVVELYAEHRIGQRLDHLTLEFDLVLLGHPLQPTSAQRKGAPPREGRVGPLWRRAALP